MFFLPFHLILVQLQCKLELKMTLSLYHSWFSLWLISCVNAKLKLRISNEGSLTTFIKDSIRFNSTVREFILYKYRYYAHTNNIRPNINCCALFHLRSYHLAAQPYFCLPYDHAEILDIFSYKLCILFGFWNSWHYHWQKLH